MYKKRLKSLRDPSGSHVLVLKGSLGVWTFFFFWQLVHHGGREVKQKREGNRRKDLFLHKQLPMTNYWRPRTAHLLFVPHPHPAHQLSGR